MQGKGVVLCKKQREYFSALRYASSTEEDKQKCCLANFRKSVLLYIYLL